MERIKEEQKNDPKLVKVMEKIREGQKSEFSIHEDGSLRFKRRVCVPDMP